MPALLALFAPVAAHVPHDTVAAFAAPADLDASVPWFLLADPQGDTLLLRSDDGGARWAFVGGEPVADALTGAARAGDVVALLGPSRLWWTDDAGAGWAEAPLPGDVDLVGGGDVLLLAGAGGLWEGLDAAAPALTDAIVALGPGPVAVGAAVWVRGAEGWTDLGAPTGAVTAAGAGGGEVYAGTEDGRVWRWDGSAWAACGAIPEAEHPEIVGFALAGEEVVVANGEHAGWASDDGCATWQDRGPDDDAHWEVTGGVRELSGAWPVLVAGGEARVAGGWAGLFGSADGGRSWTEAPVVPADHTRGIAMGPDGALFVGGYGAGVLRSFDGGATFDAPDHGLGEENVQRVVVAGDALFVVANHVGWRSDDGGVHFTSFGGGEELLAEIVPFCGGDDVWLLPDEGSELRATTDGGATWETLAPPLGDAEPVGAVALGEARCLTAEKPARVACLRGESWTVGYEGPTGAATPPVAWPAAAPTRLLFGDHAGVHLSDDGGATWVSAWREEDPPVLLAVADDDTVLLATRGGRLLRSADGGGTWEEPWARLPAVAHVLAPRPSFATHPDVLVGTHDGVWLVSGDADPVRFSPFLRLDDRSDFWDRAGLPDAEADTEAGLDTVQPLGVGGRMEAWVRGDRLRVLGRTDGVGRARVLVDDALVATVGESAPGGVLLDADLADDWHQVALVGEVAGVAIDAVEATGPGALLEGEPGEPPPGPCEVPASYARRCGCGEGSGAAGLLLLLARRRRRDGGRAP